jgi:hypothetical protein
MKDAPLMKKSKKNLAPDENSGRLLHMKSKWQVLGENKNGDWEMIAELESRETAFWMLDLFDRFDNRKKFKNFKIEEVYI